MGSNEIFMGLKEFAIWLALMYLIGLVLLAIVNQSPMSRDDSDSGKGWFDSRSGVSVITDAKTGCQYLAWPNGGITPRLDKGGNHICITGKENKHGD